MRELEHKKCLLIISTRKLVVYECAKRVALVRFLYIFFFLFHDLDLQLVGSALQRLQFPRASNLHVIRDS